jgi:sialate O-acetylesterase
VKKRWGWLIVLAVAVSAHADVKLPALLSDGMVLQRDLPIHFWGMASPGENVTVTFLNHAAASAADSLGRWNVYLPPVSAGGPYEVTIQGTNRIVLHDVLVGDVWIASGQSNMEFPMRQLANAEQEITAANFPNIHLLIVKRSASEYPLPDMTTTGWAACSPQSARDFSAVAFYFAREIQQKEKVPLGIIQSAWGGTVAEAWTSMDALTADPGLMPIFAVRARMMDDRVETMMLQKQEDAQRAEAKAKGLPEPKFPWHPEPEIWRPAALFNGMIAPLAAFPIRGVIWYQGESNSIVARAPYIYGKQFRALIEDWRRHWGQGDFPFLYVQISNFKSTAEEDWPTIREGQRSALALRNTGMAVTIDIGNPDDVHPLDKSDVGHRLALIARANVYGEHVEYSGPLVREVTRDGNGLRVWFDHVGGGLMVKGPTLTSFEVAGADGKFQAAEARVDGSTIVVTTTTVERPTAVRYGWANSPDCNLFNQEGLPASPFSVSLPPLH